MTNAPLRLELRDLGHRFGPRVLFAHLTADLQVGDVLIVAGDNGSGKSTLLRIVAGLQQPSAGQARLWRGDRALTPAERRATVGYAAPDVLPYRPLTVRENLVFFAKVRGVPLDLVELTEPLGLTPRLDQPVQELSSGYVQRVRLALALLHRPAVLLLDEPTVMLDSVGREQVGAVIARQRERGITLLATNDPTDHAWGTRIARLT